MAHKHKSEMSEAEWHREIGAAIQELLVDSGKRRWSELSKYYQVVLWSKAQRAKQDEG